MAERNLTLLAVHFHNHGDVEVNGSASPGRETASRGRVTDAGAAVRRRLPLVGAVAGGLAAVAGLAWIASRRP